MEQLTQRGRQPWHVEPMQVSQLRRSIGKNQARQELFNDALATDWSSSRIDMQDVYFFALEVRNSLSSFGWFGRRGARRLNRVFGYRLLSTFLDQQIVAWRLLPDEAHTGIDEDERATYYADNYGLSDSRYIELVEWLAEDLLIHRASELPPRVNDRLARKGRAVAERALSEYQKSSRTSSPDQPPEVAPNG